MSDQDPAALEVSGLSVSYGRGRTLRQVLDGVDLRVAAGEIVGLIGETGSGKSTLARAALGLVPSSGEIRVAGRSLTGLSLAETREFRRSGRLQYVFQDPLQSLDPDLPVGQSITEGLRIRGVTDRRALEQVVTHALERVNVDVSLARRLPEELSGGQRQRVAIARALSVDPGIVILDEPVSALDAANRIQILELLRRLRAEQGLAQLFISHDLGSVAGIADRVVVLYRGRIVEEGPVAAVVGDPQHAYTKLLISSAPMLGAAGASRDERRALQAALAAASAR